MVAEKRHTCHDSLEASLRDLQARKATFHIGSLLRGLLPSDDGLEHLPHAILLFSRRQFLLELLLISAQLDLNLLDLLLEACGFLELFLLNGGAHLLLHSIERLLV